MDKPKVDGHDDAARSSGDVDAAPRAGTAKKAYVKPVLSKHEQLHGIGIGTN